MDIDKLLNLGAGRIIFARNSAKIGLITTVKDNSYDFSLEAAANITAEMALGGYINPVVRIKDETATLVFSHQP